jgi:hypothetical protein
MGSYSLLFSVMLLLLTSLAAAAAAEQQPIGCPVNLQHLALQLRTSSIRWLTVLNLCRFGALTLACGACSSCSESDMTAVQCAGNVLVIR